MTMTIGEVMESTPIIVLFANVLYAGDYRYHGAAVDTLHGTHGTTCYASRNNHVYGCTTVIHI